MIYITRYAHPSVRCIIFTHPCNTCSGLTRLVRSRSIRLECWSGICGWITCEQAWRNISRTVRCQKEPPPKNAPVDLVWGRSPSHWKWEISSERINLACSLHYDRKWHLGIERRKVLHRFFKAGKTLKFLLGALKRHVTPQEFQGGEN